MMKYYEILKAAKLGSDAVHDRFTALYTNYIEKVIEGIYFLQTKSIAELELMKVTEMEEY